jgi:hypothetical protein
VVPLHVLCTSTFHAIVPKSLFVQCITSPPICTLIPMTSTLHDIFLHACDLPPRTSMLHVVIIHEREPLPMNCMSHIEIIQEYIPPQVKFMSHVATPIMIFLI